MSAHVISEKKEAKMNIINQWSLPSGGKHCWKALGIEDTVISLDGDKRYHITEVRCALNLQRRCNKCHRPMKGTTAYDGACECGGLIEMPTEVGTLKMVRNDDRRFVSFVREPDTVLLRYGYRRLDWATKEEVIIGDASLFVDDLTDEYERERIRQLAERSGLVRRNLEVYPLDD